MTAPGSKLKHTWPAKDHYVPIKLKTLIARYGLSQRRISVSIVQANGRACSDTVVGQLVNWDIWPKQTPRAEIQCQVEAYLRAAGVPEAEIAGCWEVEPDAPRNPRGVASVAAIRHPTPAAPAAEIRPVEPEMLTQAARKHFSLFRDPFADDVQGADDIFLSPDIRYIREALYTTARHGGFLAVVGESGAGKTILRRDLIDRIARESQPISVIQPRCFDKGYLTASYICEAIIQDVRPGERMRHSLEAKARQVERLLTDSSRAGHQHVLLIEEAHDLSISTLKYLKRFWELEDGFRKLLSIVLIGQPELKAKLDERQHFEAREVIRRIEIAELLPLDTHLEPYLQLKFKRIGRELDDIFARDAFDAIRTRLTLARRPGEVISLLYPLVVNNAVTRALNLAAEAGAPKVTADVVREV